MSAQLLIYYVLLLLQTIRVNPNEVNCITNHEHEIPQVSIQIQLLTI